jgi:hypothetical protein
MLHSTNVDLRREGPIRKSGVPWLLGVEEELREEERAESVPPRVRGRRAACSQSATQFGAGRLTDRQTDR